MIWEHCFHSLLTVQKSAPAGEEQAAPPALLFSFYDAFALVAKFQSQLGCLSQRSFEEPQNIVSVLWTRVPVIQLNCVNVLPLDGEQLVGTLYLLLDLLHLLLFTHLLVFLPAAESQDWLYF